MKFEKGDIVKLCGFTRREATNDRSCKYGIRYFLQCYTKEHDIAELKINDYDVKYVILPTNAMPVFSRLEDGELIKYYPIQELNDSHSKKVFISEVYLKKVGSLNDYNITDEVDSSEDDEDEWDDDEELNADAEEPDETTEFVSAILSKSRPNTPPLKQNNWSFADNVGEIKKSNKCTDSEECEYKNLKRSQEFLKISNNINTVINSLQNIIDSLTKIAKDEV